MKTCWPLMGSLLSFPIPIPILVSVRKTLKHNHFKRLSLENINCIKLSGVFDKKDILTPYGSLTWEKLPYLSLFGLSHGTFLTNNKGK